MKFVINDRVVLLREPEGPLAPYIVPLWKRVIDEGYAPCSVRRRIRIVVGFSRWLAEKSVCLRSMSSRHFDSYRDTFRQFLKFAQHRLHKLPSALGFEEIDAPLVVAFLDHVERHQGLSARSRNLRLTAIHSFFCYAAFELPTHSAQIQRVLAIPSRRFTRTIVRFLVRSEVDALLAAPDRHTWFARRDHAFVLMAVQTGLRLSEITGAKREDLVLGTGAHVRVIGKGRKERCTPLAKPTVAVLRAWLSEPQRGNERLLFPNAKGERLSVHGVQHLLKKHSANAARVCPSLKGKRVTVHLLRHTMALELLQAGVDRAVIALWLGHESVETTQIATVAAQISAPNAIVKTRLHWTCMLICCRPLAFGTRRGLRSKVSLRSSVRSISVIDWLLP